MGRGARTLCPATLVPGVGSCDMLSHDPEGSRVVNLSSLHLGLKESEELEMQRPPKVK